MREPVRARGVGRRLRPITAGGAQWTRGNSLSPRPDPDHRDASRRSVIGGDGQAYPRGGNQATGRKWKEATPRLVTPRGAGAPHWCDLKVTRPKGSLARQPPRPMRASVRLRPGERRRQNGMAGPPEPFSDVVDLTGQRELSIRSMQLSRAPPFTALAEGPRDFSSERDGEREREREEERERERRSVCAPPRGERMEGQSPHGPIHGKEKTAPGKGRNDSARARMRVSRRGPRARAPPSSRPVPAPRRRLSLTRLNRELVGAEMRAAPSNSSPLDASLSLSLPPSHSLRCLPRSLFAHSSLTPSLSAFLISWRLRFAEFAPVRRSL